MFRRAKPLNAFSLVELSIVLVILGLLVGGVLAGQSLIQASALRSIGNDFQRYHSAFYSFRDKYMALPGDFPDAHIFWTSAGGTGRDFACFRAQTINSQATCGGNGNGEIAQTDGVAHLERFSAWKHLANAGLIEGTYSGYTQGGAGSHIPLAGTNVPASKGMDLFFDISWAYFDGSNPNMFLLKQNFNVISIFNINGWRVLLPEEAWNIDLKLDDGKPASGSILSMKASASSNCTTTDDLDSEYNVTLHEKRCALMFKL